MMSQDDARPDLSPEAVARRKKSTDQARAMNMRAGYVWNAEFEEITARYVEGDLTGDEYRELAMPKARTKTGS